MANELDNLRPEVRRANSFLDSMACSEDERAAVHTIRAELLRLVGDLNAACLSRDTFEAKYQCMRERAERAEAELAALKARIAGSRHAFLGPNMDRITFLADEIGPSGKYALVKVEE